MACTEVAVPSSPLDTQTAPSAQNMDDNGSQKHMAEPNASLYRTLSLAACASALKLRVPAAHMLGSGSGPYKLLVKYHVVASNDLQAGLIYSSMMYK